MNKGIKMKETATARRAREAREAAEEYAKFEAEKPMRLLHAIAEAYELGFTATTLMKYDNVLCYFFDFNDEVYTDPYAELGSWTMHNIETRISTEKAKRDRKARLEKVKLELLTRLTNEEKEALGI